MSELHPTRIASASLYLQFHIISHSSSSFGMDYAIAYLQSSTHLRCIATACFWYGLQYTESANPLAVLSRVGMNHSADEEWWMNDEWLWFMIDYEWLMMNMMNHDCATYYQHEHVPWFSKLIDLSFTKGLWQDPSGRGGHFPGGDVDQGDRGPFLLVPLPAEL